MSVSPSFNNYSSAKLAEIAARVVKELGQEPDPDDDIFSWAAENPPQQSQEASDTEAQREQDEDGEFEFAVVCREPEYSSPISADEIFYNGQIRPLYPIFDQTLLLSDSHTNTHHSKASLSTLRRPPLKKLMVEEREREREREQQEEAREPMSCSSSEADELDGVAPGTYCVWAPTKPSSATEDCSSSSSRRKKSLSTGSSKRWKLRDLLYRSNSDGKDTFVFVTPSKKAEKTVAVASSNESGIKAKVAPPQQLDAHYARNSSVKEEDHKRRSSYLPYRKDLVGFFANVNGLNRSLQPF